MAKKSAMSSILKIFFISKAIRDSDLKFGWCVRERQDAHVGFCFFAKSLILSDLLEKNPKFEF